MPMIDVYAATGTFPDTRQLAKDLAARLMAIEQVPDIPLFRKNTAAFIHDLPADCLSNVDGDTSYVRVQVLTNAGTAGVSRRRLRVFGGRPLAARRVFSSCRAFQACRMRWLRTTSLLRSAAAGRPAASPR